MLPEPPPAALRLRRDAEALAANWRALDALSAPDVATGAAVKADAYGLGVGFAVPVLRDAGCADFFVAHWSEVPAVLDHVPARSLAVLHGPLTDADAQFAKATGVRPVINSLQQARHWSAAGGGACDLMVDTGMNRLGLPMRELGDAAVAALDIATLHSHLASADENSPLNETQRLRWEEARRAVPHQRASLANSAGICLGAPYHGALTRPGLALYGGVPRPELSETIKQVAHIQSAVLQLREIGTGETIGYNATFTAPHDMRIATIALGYADGFLRSWGGQGALLSPDGARLPILGRVSMDMIVVDCVAAPDLKEGDWLDVPYALPEAAQASGLSQYELLTVLGKRFDRA